MEQLTNNLNDQLAVWEKSRPTGRPLLVKTVPVSVLVSAIAVVGFSLTKVMGEGRALGTALTLGISSQLLLFFYLDKSNREELLREGANLELGKHILYEIWSGTEVSQNKKTDLIQNIATQNRWLAKSIIESWEPEKMAKRLISFDPVAVTFLVEEKTQNFFESSKINNWANYLDSVGTSMNGVIENCNDLRPIISFQLLNKQINYLLLSIKNEKKIRNIEKNHHKFIVDNCLKLNSINGSFYRSQMNHYETTIEELESEILSLKQKLRQAPSIAG
jgi:hypothetical protein